MPEGLLGCTWAGWTWDKGAKPGRGSRVTRPKGTVGNDSEHLRGNHNGLFKSPGQLQTPREGGLA